MQKQQILGRKEKEAPELPGLPHELRKENPLAWLGLGFSILCLIGTLTVFAELRELAMSRPPASSNPGSLAPLSAAYYGFTSFLTFSVGALLCGAVLLIAMTLNLASMANNTHVAACLGMACCFLSMLLFLLPVWRAMS